MAVDKELARRWELPSQSSRLRPERESHVRGYLPLSVAAQIKPIAVEVNAIVASSHRGRKSTFRDSISVPQLVFFPRAANAGRAAIFSPRWMMKAS